MSLQSQITALAQRIATEINAIRSEIAAGGGVFKPFDGLDTNMWRDFATVVLHQKRSLKHGARRIP